MNKSAIKGFSVRARRKLIEGISQKAYALGIKDTGKYDEVEEFEGGFRIKDAVNQIEYPMIVKKDREKLISEINKKSFEQVVEEVAYTWFNRIIAIRFMEVNEYLPVKVRILSSEIKGKVEPDVLTNIYDCVDELELDRDKVFELKENHKDEELFKYVFVRECNNLGKLMPQVFEVISDFTELLLPDQLLVSGSIVRDLIESIEEESFKEEVEIIGWMYQYYISEKKDEVFAALKKNKKITKENIPAATQLFTPKWIVKYMTENSFGRLWQESHPNEELKNKWEYYIESAEQEVEVQKKLNKLKNPKLSPEEIKILDPAMGSGHILVYAFDVLYDIYLSRGYAERDIPQLILEKNLYGLDIDDRAAQLATFALLMKARSKNRRFFKKAVELNICSIQESNGFSNDALEYLVNPKDTKIEKFAQSIDINYLIDVFKDAKDYGSILHVDKVDFNALRNRLNDIETGDNLNIFEFGHRNEILSLLPNLLMQAKIMSAKYDVVISNPPYMGNKGMCNKLIIYSKLHYPDSKADFYSIFMEKCRDFTKSNGYYAMITQPTWMFLSTFEKMRTKMISENIICSLLHMGRGIFGIDFGSSAFVIRNSQMLDYRGQYYRLHQRNFKYIDLREIERIFKLGKDNIQYTHDFSIYDKNSTVNEEETKKDNQLESKDYILKVNNTYQQKHLLDVPGKPIAYWVTNKTREMFLGKKLLGNIESPVEGIKTGDNDRFLRLWHEVSKNSLGNKWYFMAKGGEYRKWYGNIEHVIEWENEGKKVKEFKKSTVSNSDLFLLDAITWGYISSYKLSTRYLGKGFLYNNKGPACFIKNSENLYYLLGLTNSKVVETIMKFLAPTLDFKPGNIKKIPITITEDISLLEEINKKVKECWNISKNDWDSSEMSYDFKTHPLLQYAEIGNNLVSLKSSYEQMLQYSLKQFNKLKWNEEELNKVFIDIYGLDSELNPYVDDKDVTAEIANKENAIKSFISYAVGCIFGRYSIDEEGLCYAGGDFDIGQYKRFIPVQDNILMITEDDYYNKDILHCFVEFVKKTFGNETLDDNLKYIANVINSKSKGSARQTIRNYFIKDFYKDHCKMYKKRPIYWMIDSGKQNGVKALLYMHRYDKSTIARFRTDYLHEIQRYYENDIELTEKTNDKKRVDKLKKKLQEVTEFDKVVAHIAHQQIEFDLDEGVEHNYELFQGIEVPQGDGQKPLRANLLAKRK